MNLQHDLSKICKQIMLEQPFYGLLLLNLNKEWTNKVPTAGVGLNGLNHKLYINPEYWQSLSENHKKGLILHELKHIAFFHPTEFKHLKDKEIANIAMDIEINQKIPKDLLPPTDCILEKFESYGLHPNEGTNVYYEKLLQQKDKMKESQSPIGAMIDLGNGEQVKKPNHKWDDFENISETQKKMVVKQIEGIILEIAEQLKNRGSLPYEVQILLDKYKNIEPAKFNWKAYVRRFIGTSAKGIVKKTKRKRSKRFEHDFGMKLEFFSHILLAIDSSASVSDAEIQEFMNEIHHMYKTGHEFTLVFADTTMQEPIRYKPNIPIVIKKRGGTDFNEVVDYYMANRRKYTTLIYLTDGEAPAPNANVRNMLWVLSTISKECDHLPGKIVKLN